MTDFKGRSRLLSMLVVVVLGLGMASCGSSSDSSDGGSDGGSGGTETTAARGLDPDSPYCRELLSNNEEDVDLVTRIEEETDLAPDELADAYQVLSENLDLVDAYDSLDEAQREPIQDEVEEIVAYAVQVCGMPLGG